MTQREIIKKLLEDTPRNWFFSWQLIKVNTPYGFLGSGSDRIARDMAENGEIEKRRDGKYAEYRAKLKETLW